MACSVVKVLAPNGKPSILYNSILNDVKDQSLALSKYLEIKGYNTNNSDSNGEPIYNNGKLSFRQREKLLTNSLFGLDTNNQEDMISPCYCIGFIRIYLKFILCK